MNQKGEMKRNLTVPIMLYYAVLIIAVGGNRAYSDNEAKYFPERAFHKEKDPDDFVSKWYTGQLTVLDEPSIWLQKDSGKTIYRFTWLRTFHEPISIRVEIGKDFKSRLFVKECNGKGGYAPGILIVNEKRELSTEETKEFLKIIKENTSWDIGIKDKGEDPKKVSIEENKVKKNDDGSKKLDFDELKSFFNILDKETSSNTKPEAEEKEEIGLDGAEWIFEGLYEKKYQVFRKWSPKAGKARELGLYFLKLSGLSIDAKDIY